MMMMQMSRSGRHGKPANNEKTAGLPFFHSSLLIPALNTRQKLFCCSQILILCQKTGIPEITGFTVKLLKAPNIESPVLIQNDKWTHVMAQTFPE